MGAPTDWAVAIEAAELAGLGVYARAALATAHEGDTAVVSLRLTVTLQAQGLTVVEGEWCDAGGDVLGGFGL